MRADNQLFIAGMGLESEWSADVRVRGAMYLSKQLTPKSLPDIGRRFGGRDHTTVIHAVRQIEKLRASDAELDADIRLLTRQLEG